ncbi:DENN domain-containing protein 1B isoform X1 [Thalassophryne amazonica]|uniref:DENN domain-containing protein 1B isoform X1 n=1 Tax=Thalassophryne amazonica TaxID=390379 RepID=UPI0014720E1B|nr:DENN domain-containing protein 1B isoform X1 [Thalassophryne amazonica]
MGSRLKQNPERTFDWFFEASCPVSRDKDPGVLFQFPEDFSDEDSCKTLPRFCFPYDIQRVRDGVAVQHFTFVLTDLEACQRFGFCRLTNSTQICLCIISYLPWFEVFYKLLNNLADYLTKGQTSDMKSLLAALYKQPVPLAAGSLILQMVPFFIAPDPRSLPSIPENRNLTELIVAVDVGNLLQLYASMLFERRILVFATKLSTLTSCVHALSAVLYPMYWQHIFIPVLPPHLLDYCCAPMPYLIGVHTSLSERVRSRGLEDIVILNVDTNTLETPFDDFKMIPSEVMSGLKMCLKRQAVSPGCGVSKAFMKVQALLFGGYRDALQVHEDGGMWFSEELFLDHKSPSMRQFLQRAVHLQFFKQFIDGRLDILNKGMEPDDLFEEEILKCETREGTSRSYQQLISNLKKGGGDMIVNMKSKANMRVKGLTKSSLKNLLMHKTHTAECSLQRGRSVAHRCAQSDCLQNRLPITQHFGTSRPRRPVNNLKISKEENLKEGGDTWDGAASGPVTGLDSELQEDREQEEDLLMCDSEEMDLLGEIFDTLSSRSSRDCGVLYGTRSLDLFGPNSHNYITKYGPANPSQESLCLSDSLHSWNLEEGIQSTEEMFLADDSDWPCIDTNVADEEGSKCRIIEKVRREELSENKGKVEVTINQEKIDGDSSVEVSLHTEKSEDGQQNIEGFGEEPVEKRDEKQDNELKEKWKDGTPHSEDIHGHKMGSAGHGEQKIFRRAEEEKNNPQCDYNVSAAEEQVTIPVSTDTSETQVFTAKCDLQDKEKRSEEAVRKKEQEIRLAVTSPRVQSAVAQLHISNQDFPIKSMTRSLTEPKKPGTIFYKRENSLTQWPYDSKPQSEVSHHAEMPKEDDIHPIRVSELKKRFEA